MAQCAGAAILAFSAPTVQDERTRGLSMLSAIPLFPPLIAAISDTQWLAAAGIGLLAIYIMMRPRSKKDPLQRSGPKLTLTQQKSIERQMESLLVEFSNMARQMSAQLDTRSAKLELLIKEADQKLAELKAAVGTPNDNAAGHAAAEVALQRLPLPSTADAPLFHVPVPSASVPRSESPHANIYALADRGRSPHEIARELERPDGEVELILALRPKEKEPGTIP
jgi:hypothetical protein